jgi:hypothetical protein
MTKILSVLVTLFILLQGITYAETTDNFVFGVTDTSNALADAETTSETFAVLMNTYSQDVPNGTARVVVYSASCSVPSNCASREIVTISASSCVGTAPNKICTLTIAARNQESTTHSGDWASGSKVAMNITKGAADAMYQPLEATLTDIADGNIDENLVNTANPWADNEVADTLTVDGSSSVTWTALTTYPTGCTNQFVRTIGDTLTCNNVGIADLASVDFGGFTCNGSTCTTDSDGTWTIHGNYPSDCSAGNTVYGLGDTLSCMTVQKAGDYEITYANPFDINWNNGNSQYVSMTGSPTINTPTNPIAGQKYSLKLCQDGTGSRTVTWWASTIKWAGGSAPILTTTASKCDVVICHYGYDPVATANRYWCDITKNF